MAACQPSADWVEPLFSTLGGELGLLATTICADARLYFELPSKRTSHLSETVELRKEP